MHAQVNSALTVGWSTKCVYGFGFNLTHDHLFQSAAALFDMLTVLATFLHKAAPFRTKVMVSDSHILLRTRCLAQRWSNAEGCTRYATTTGVSRTKGNLARASLTPTVSFNRQLSCFLFSVKGIQRWRARSAANTYLQRCLLGPDGKAELTKNG